MKKSSNAFFIALFLMAFAVASFPARAQEEQQAHTNEATAGALFREISEYQSKKFGELKSQGKPIDQAAADKITRERNELAATYAAQLVARNNLSGQDFFYLGLIYDLIGKKDDAIAAMRKYLLEKSAATEPNAQVARTFVGTYAAQRKLFDEAENALAEYSRHTPVAPNNLFSMHYELGLAYLKAKQNERASEHARIAYQTAKSLDVKTLGRPSLRDELVYVSAAVLVDADAELKRTDEITPIITDLMGRALDAPSANLYILTTRRFANHAEELEAAKKSVFKSKSRPLAPEINAAEWIGQQPVHLSDLRRRVVLIDFWYDWCPPCRAFFPTLKSWSEKYKDAGLTVIGLTAFQGKIRGQDMARSDELAYLKKFKQDFAMPYGVAIANDISNERTYGITVYPTTVLIDRRGVVRYFGTGISPKETDELAAMIEKLLKETVPNED